MTTLFFQDYRKSGDDAYDLYRLLTDLQGRSGIRVLFEPDTYDLRRESCFERFLNISNHGWNGPKRIAVLLEGLTDVELDFAGSTLISHGVMTPFAILGSTHITVRNVILENPETRIMQATVIAHGNGYIDLEPTHGYEQLFVNRGELMSSYEECTLFSDVYVEFRGDTGEIEYGTADYTMGVSFRDLTCEECLVDGKRILRVYGARRYPPVGNVLVISSSRRLGCGFFCEDSTDIVLENVTVRSCYGMGVLAQTCEDLTLRGFHTKRKDGLLYTANADATHFVNCGGLVTVEDCTFEGQMDDALNIHGMYTRIHAKGDHELLVREEHPQARGIRIYRAGDRIQILQPDSLIPYTEKTVKAVEYINAELIRLVLNEETGDVTVGDDVENLMRSADLIFRRNTVHNNRARGMLIATRGKTVIEDCYFHTSGSAILFEANGEYWYESGGVQDVTIRGNTFDRCKHGEWGYAVVDCVPRRAIEEGKYFNRTIRVIGNDFRMLHNEVCRLDNIAEATFVGNRITCASEVAPRLIVNHVGHADIETEWPITYA